MKNRITEIKGIFAHRPELSSRVLEQKEQVASCWGGAEAHNGGTLMRNVPGGGKVKSEDLTTTGTYVRPSMK
jgi:hypothetical protein